MELKKITLVSNNIGYGPRPEPDEEVEQRLTINAAGRVWFTGYAFGQGFGKHTPARRSQLSLGKENAQKILDMLDRYFTDDRIIYMATDVGDWKLTMTGATGEKRTFTGPLCNDPILENVGISAVTRRLIPIEGLFMFDGGYADNE